MSKAVKKVLTVAAAVAVAYFAPQVAGALLKSASGAAAASTAAKVVATAAVNAAGNAAIAAATGGDVGKAAIMGAVTGGVSGYLTAPTAAATTPGAAAPAAGTTPGAITGGPTLANAGVTATGQQILTGTTPGLGVATAPGVTTSGAFAPTGATILGATSVTGVTPSAVSAAATPTLSLGQRAMGVLKDAGQEVVTKFTDPSAIADMTLRAAGQLAGSALAGSGLSPAEERLLAAQAADLQELKNTNQELYNLRLEQAKALLGEAARDYGFEEESRARVRGAGLTTAAVRGLTGERRRAELARQRRARAEETATGRARGELMTAQNTMAARQAGLSALPGAGPQAATMAARAGLMGDYAEAERRRREASEQAGQFFGGLTGQRKAGLTGEELQNEVDRQYGAGLRRMFGSITG
jgi:hypothetical protein